MIEMILHLLNYPSTPSKKVEACIPADYNDCKKSP